MRLRVKFNLMLEKPGIKDEQIVRCLQDEYGLSVEGIEFLPLGADQNTAVYRASSGDGTDHFVKLRKGDFIEASVRVPEFLASLGMRQVIPPIKTRTGRLWADLKPFRVILYPFVEGRNGFENGMSEGQWMEFGRALKQLHTAAMPEGVISGVPREDYSPRWREEVMTFLRRVENKTFDEPVALQMANLLRNRKFEILDMIRQAERLAGILQGREPEFVLCHADIHEWNLLIDSQGSLYMVDWDTLILAPRERDLMFIGAGLGETGYAPQEEERMFYEGYGKMEVDQEGIAYYRFARILEDIAVYCAEVFLSDEGGQDRRQAPERVEANFLPGRTVEAAYQALAPRKRAV